MLTWKRRPVSGLVAQHAGTTYTITPWRNMAVTGWCVHAGDTLLGSYDTQRKCRARAGAGQPVSPR